MKVISNRVTKMTVELTMEDGSIEIEELDVEGTYRHLNGTDSDQEFWVASSHPRLLTGTDAFASPTDPDNVPEESRDWTNTLIGMIKDKNCVVFATYSMDSPATVK